MDSETIIELEYVDSTSSWIRRAIDGKEGVEPFHGMAVTTHRQDAGRGQRGNSWESEPGLNLTISVLLHPQAISPANQFIISEAVAVAAMRTASHLLDSEHDVRIKWPNDLYVGDDKLAGILIENSLNGNAIEWSICGVGININQTEFSMAPNAVSLAMLTGRNYNIAQSARLFLSQLMDLSNRYLTTPTDNTSELENEYRQHLWRREGFHPYHDKIRGENIMAAIDNISPEGFLTLRLTNNSLRTFAFKEVVPLISKCNLKN